jgi:hypothetical protein
MGRQARIFYPTRRLKRGSKRRNPATLPTKVFVMSITITNPSAHGTAETVVSQSQPRDPIGDKPWGAPSQHPAVAGFANTAETQVVTVPNSVVDFLGMPMNRR